MANNNPTGINQFSKSGRSAVAKKKSSGGFHGGLHGYSAKKKSKVEETPKKKRKGGFHGGF